MFLLWTAVGPPASCETGRGFLSSVGSSGTSRLESGWNPRGIESEHKRFCWCGSRTSSGRHGGQLPPALEVGQELEMGEYLASFFFGVAARHSPWSGVPAPA